MGKIGSLIVLLLIGVALYFSFIMDSELGIEKDEEKIDSNIVTSADKVLTVKENNFNRKVLFEEGFHTLIGQPVEFIQEEYGDPKRVDLSSYDYEWWVYPDVFENGYLQVGIAEEKVVTVYAIGDETLPSFPFELGTSYNEVNLEFPFEDQVSFNVKNNSYQFNLSKEELETRPLVYVDGIFIQLYFDIFTKELSSIRYLDRSTIIKHRPYSIVYRGELIEARPLSETDWRKVEKGSSLQIFSITNEIRKKHSLQALNWDEETANVAYYHSEDMRKNEYFSHTSPDYGELKDRLKREEILYKLAGENIAAKYVDAIEAVEGWLNSEGHRVNLLHEDFTHLGVGVYERYYTQNFITPW